MSKTYATFDRSDPKFTTVTFTGEKADDDNFQDYLEGLSLNYEVDHPITVLFDASKASFPSFKHQKMQAQWLKENEALMKKQCLGIAYLIPNKMIRQALKLIFTIQKQPVPYKVCSSKKEARHWLLDLHKQ